MLTHTAVQNQAASTVDEFCNSHRISRGTFYKLLRHGNGPRVMKVGSRTLISAEAAADWRSTQEHAQAREAA